MKKEPKETRFERIHLEDNDYMPTIIILRDKQTGAQYLFVRSASGGGLTPLLGADGKPIIDKGSE